jgi:hypothetical protein
MDHTPERVVRCDDPAFPPLLVSAPGESIFVLQAESFAMVWSISEHDEFFSKKAVLPCTICPATRFVLLLTQSQWLSHHTA